ncbi:DUF2798 domain-containing protein [Corallincola luteus]|uniref:DUF2798 domain-containing protein n=1 Tax=Corallincola luteus TaxID=1775177 RepID=A0ABY2AH94_9GAMM|nr:DUF2798 domain-containing protein [Corallincola luteus]TCI01968.1 DUF2798 domain-containing protein [Corallincola luteus]
MKKLPKKFQYPLIISMVMPTMLLGMPAIFAFRQLPGDSFQFKEWVNVWQSTVVEFVPFAFLLLVIVASTARLLVTKLLIENDA